MPDDLESWRYHTQADPWQLQHWIMELRAIKWMYPSWTEATDCIADRCWPSICPRQNNAETVSCSLISLPGWFISHRAARLSWRHFRDLKKERSHGCNLWVHWDGNIIMTTWFCLAFFTSKLIVWLACPSASNKTGCGWDYGCLVMRRCSNHSVNSSSLTILSC